MNDDTTVEVGNRIYHLRKDLLKMTQKEFAERLGVGPSYISMVEKGREIPSTVLSKLICAEFRVRETWLNGGQEPVFWEWHEELVDIVLAAGPDRVIAKVVDMTHKNGAVADVARALMRWPANTTSDYEFAIWLRFVIEEWAGADAERRTLMLGLFDRGFGRFREQLSVVPARDRRGK